MAEIPKARPEAKVKPIVEGNASNEKKPNGRGQVLAAFGRTMNPARFFRLLARRGSNPVSSIPFVEGINGPVAAGKLPSSEQAATQTYVFADRLVRLGVDAKFANNPQYQDVFTSQLHRLEQKATKENPKVNLEQVAKEATSQFVGQQRIKERGETLTDSTKNEYGVSVPQEIAVEAEFQQQFDIARQAAATQMQVDGRPIDFQKVAGQAEAAFKAQQASEKPQESEEVQLARQLKDLGIQSDTSNPELQEIFQRRLHETEEQSLQGNGEIDVSKIAASAGTEFAQKSAFNEISHDLRITIGPDATVDDVITTLNKDHGWQMDSNTRNYVQGAIEHANSRPASGVAVEGAARPDQVPPADVVTAVDSSQQTAEQTQAQPEQQPETPAQMEQRIRQEINGEFNQKINALTEVIKNQSKENAKMFAVLGDLVVKNSLLTEEQDPKKRKTLLQQIIAIAYAAGLIAIEVTPPAVEAVASSS